MATPTKSKADNFKKLLNPLIIVRVPFTPSFKFFCYMTNLFQQLSATYQTDNPVIPFVICDSFSLIKQMLILHDTTI